MKQGPLRQVSTATCSALAVQHVSPTVNCQGSLQSVPTKPSHYDRTGCTRTPNAPALKDGVEAAPNVLVLEPNACATNYINTLPPSKVITTCCVSAIRTGVVLPNMPVLGAAPKGADACTDSAGC